MTYKINHHRPLHVFIVVLLESLFYLPLDFFFPPRGTDRCNLFSENTYHIYVHTHKVWWIQRCATWKGGLAGSPARRLFRAQPLAISSSSHLQWQRDASWGQVLPWQPLPMPGRGVGIKIWPPRVDLASSHGSCLFRNPCPLAELLLSRHYSITFPSAQACFRWLLS